MRHAVLIATLAALLLAAAPAVAKVKLKTIGSFQTPTYVTSAPGTPGVLVVEQEGRVISVNGRKRRLFLDIRGVVKSGGEQGLLSLAFPPDYRSSGLFYGYYTDSNGSLTIAEFRRGSKFHADPAYRRQVLLVPHPGPENHNGGQLQFGPDGLLYIGTGDGGGSGDTDNSAQTTDNLLGKILRIDPKQRGASPYTSPGSNPFVPGPGRDEIYSIGLRNPYRFSFNRDKIAIGDVGQDRFEEVDYETVAGASGANFGWNDFEGFAPFGGAIPPAPARHDKPILAYAHAGSRCSVIGGYVVHSGKLAGRYVFGDFCDGKLRSLVPRLGGARKVRRLGVTVPMLSSFGLGANGALYATSLEGPVYRVRSGR
jgi:glucose/arabinose dehydrogenase